MKLLPGMSYLLLEIIAIAASLIIAGWHCAREMQPSGMVAAQSNNTEVFTPYIVYGDAPPSPSINDDLDHGHFPVGSIVEVRADNSYFATPAIVVGIQRTKKNSSIKYDLHRTITHEWLDGIDPELIRPYQVYEDGTGASCNIALLRNVYIAPCSVISHEVGQSGAVHYQVSYLNFNQELVDDILPFSRVQRVHGRKFGSLV